MSFVSFLLETFLIICLWDGVVYKLPLPPCVQPFVHSHLSQSSFRVQSWKCLLWFWIFLQRKFSKICVMIQVPRIEKDGLIFNYLKVSLFLWVFSNKNCLMLWSFLSSLIRRTKMQNILTINIWPLFFQS